jgi:hypothetical protein
LNIFNSNNQSGQIGKILGERWKNMTDKDKQQYEAKATKDKERYEAEKRAYHVLAPLFQTLFASLILFYRLELFCSD